MPVFLFVDIDQCVGINELDENEFVVYPNPANTFTRASYNITEAAEVAISIYDAGGQLIQVVEKVFRGTGEHNIEIEISSLKSGIYIIDLQTSNGTHSSAYFTIN